MTTTNHRSSHNNISNISTNNTNSNNIINQPPLPPIPTMNTNNKNSNGSSIKHSNKNRNYHSLSFDMRRVKKIRRLDRKIRSISSGTSKELQREIDKITREKDLKLEQLSEAKASEINDSRNRYNLIIREIEKEMNDKKKTLQTHCIRELQRVKTRIINNHKNNERATFIIAAIQNSLIKTGEKKIRISIKRKYKKPDIKNDIESVFANWQNEIQFNTKRATRAATKNKRAIQQRGIYGSTDLSRIRFHLREDEIKSDLRHLLDEEQKYDDVNRSHTNQRQSQRQSRYNYYNNNMNPNNINNNNMDMDDDISSAFHSQPTYADRHIGGITNKLGPLNDPCIEDPLYPRTSRRMRVARVNYHSMDNNYNYNFEENNTNNVSMYHTQEVHYHAYDKSTNEKKVCASYTNNDSEIVSIPIEERGHSVVISNFTVKHGSVVRLNYLGNNTTIDAQVVTIKKNQLSAVTLVGKKRKRIWYKELRIGKINIAPATAYR